MPFFLFFGLPLRPPTEWGGVHRRTLRRKTRYSTHPPGPTGAISHWIVTMCLVTPLAPAAAGKGPMEVTRVSLQVIEIPSYIAECPLREQHGCVTCPLCGVEEHVFGSRLDCRRCGVLNPEVERSGDFVGEG